MRAVIKRCWFGASCVAYHVTYVWCATVRSSATVTRDTQTRISTEKKFVQLCTNLASQRLFRSVLSVFRPISTELRREWKRKMCRASNIYLSSLRDTCIQFINLFLYIFMRCKYYAIMYSRRCLYVATVVIVVRRCCCCCRRMLRFCRRIVLTIKRNVCNVRMGNSQQMHSH